MLLIFATFQVKRIVLKADVEVPAVRRLFWISEFRIVMHAKQLRGCGWSS